MLKRQYLESVAGIALAVLAIILAGVPNRATSQEKPATQRAPAVSPAAKSKAPAARKARKPPRGRLPAFFKDVVDNKQRDQIYAIEREYQPQIDALKAQLATLTKEREEKIAAVLTPEQQKKLEQLRQEAKAKRATKTPKKPAAKKKPATAE